MSDMKEISIRDLHRHTGVWVRSARNNRAIIVRDRNVPVATLTPVAGEPLINRFERWRPMKKFAAALDRPVKGTTLETIISEDRDR